MIQNLPENWLYEKLPLGVISLDERGLIRALISGYQDRVEDLRSYTRKFSLLLSASGLPDTTNNVVLTDLLTPDGTLYTRSLDVLPDTPEAGTDALLLWVSAQLNLPLEQISNVRYGTDALRLVDADTRDFLAASIGAVIYQTAAITGAEADATKTRILRSYFPRLKIKGTAQSFEILGRILGFSDVAMTPLYGRLSAHLPNDIGSLLNAADFSTEPDFVPQQVISPFYDPHRTNDGPFFEWSGTASSATGASDFYTQALNGFQPFFRVVVLATANGTVTAPDAGVYEMSGGAPHTKAQVDAGGIRFQALADGEWFNGLKVSVTVNNNGSRVVSVLDRLSAIKYRASYFDLTLAVSFDEPGSPDALKAPNSRAEQVFGTSAVRSNPDLRANPSLTDDGAALSPYRPWSGGTITTGYAQEGFLVQSAFMPLVTNGTDTFDARVQAAGTVRQHNMDAIIAAGAQAASVMDEVRPATRSPLRVGAGFVTLDEAIYAKYATETVLVGQAIALPPPTSEVNPGLNYSSFKNWTVTAGAVDLIGAGPTITMFDLVPGNGLYVDSVGNPQPGELTSKALLIPAGTYAFDYYVAGNWRDSTKAYSMQANVGTYAGMVSLGTLSNRIVRVADYHQPFTQYTDIFAMQSSGTVRIQFKHIYPNDTSFGLLYDRISLTETISGDNYFFDSFDVLGTLATAALEGYATGFPRAPYRVEFTLLNGNSTQTLVHETDAFDTGTLRVRGVRETSVNGTQFGVALTGTYDYDTNYFKFNFPNGLPYGYQIIAHWTPTSTEVVRPEPALEPTVIGIVGDPHENNVGQRAAAAMILGWNPHAVMVVGDSALPTAADNIASAMAPYVPYRDAGKLFSAIGNHDYSPNASGTSLTEYFAFYNNLPGNGRYYSKRVGDVEMFVYNMGWNSTLALPLNQTATLEPDGIDELSIQGLWLKSALAASTAPWKMVFIHFEPYGSFLVNATRYPGYYASRLPFKQWGADLVFSGHIHAYERVIVDGLNYVTCGWSGHPQLRQYEQVGPIIPGSVVRFPVEPQAVEYGGVRVSATATTLILEARTVNGRLVDSLKLGKDATGLFDYQARPEDDIDIVEVTSNGSSLYPLLDLVDDYPWRRSIVGGGEDVDADSYVTTVEDAGALEVSEATSVPDQTGVEHNVAVIDSSSGYPRVVFYPRPYDALYEPGQPSIGYIGTVKDVSTYTDGERALHNTFTDAETAFSAGFSLYHVGLVNGVLVADPQKFNRDAHRRGLVGWLPFNEHVEDDLTPVDRAIQSVVSTQGVRPEHRTWDSTHGWNLELKPGSEVKAVAWRSAADDFTMSVWLAKPYAFTGGVSTSLEHGPVSLDVDGSLGIVLAYVRDVGGVRQLVGSYQLLSTFRQFTFRKTATSAFFGYGDLNSSVVETGWFGATAPFSDTDTTLTLQGQTAFCIRDLRMWNVFKSEADLNAVRSHQPQASVATYRIGVYRTLNRGDRVAMRVLTNGFAIPAVLPPNIREPKLRRVQRYNSMGRYSGESRFKETGLGGGRSPESLAAPLKLGNQFTNVTATGTTVAASNIGNMPGVNALWLNDRAPGQFVSVSTGTFVPKESEWKYLDDGSNQFAGTPYYSVAYDDSAWKRGVGYFGYGRGDQRTTIYYGPNANAKYTTSYYRRTFVVDDVANLGPLELGVRRDDGVVVYINGVEVVRQNMAAGAYTSATFANVTVNVDPDYRVKILPASVLVNGTNYIAADVHQSSLASSDTAFDAYLSLAFNGTGGATSILSTAAGTWPQAMVETNPNREEVWVKGDDGYVYEVKLNGNGGSTSMVAERIVRGYSAPEIAFFGTSYGTRYIEQPTGAEVILAGNSQILAVATGGTQVYQKAWSGTIQTPPLFMYLDRRTVEEAPDAYLRWNEAGNTLYYGERQTPKVAARDTNGSLEFIGNTAPLRPGYYQLVVESGNFGTADADFEGFSVEISVDATVVEPQKKQTIVPYAYDANGNIRGTDSYEFYFNDTVTSEWVLTFKWSNAFSDPTRNQFRRLAIYSYSLRRIETELWRVGIGPTDPSITKLDTIAYSPATPGGWLVALNSYGTAVQHRHESQVYPTSDTVTSKVPLSSLLTATTGHRREDILITANGTQPDFIPSEAAPLVLPSFGTVSEALAVAPMFLWAGGYEPEHRSAVVAAKMTQQTAAVRVAYAPENQWPSGAQFTQFGVANSDNRNVAKFVLEDLQPHTRYYYAAANGTLVDYNVVGTLTTWGTEPFSFQFVATSCVQNITGAPQDGTIFDVMRALNPLLFLNLGDLNYNISLTQAEYSASFELPFQAARQARLMRACAVDWTWDDHDLGINDSNREYLGVPEAWRAYRHYAPHYQLPAGDDAPIYHAFTVGNCRFICTDNRSDAHVVGYAGADKSKLGREQREWLKAELLRSKGKYGVVFWVNSDPWISSSTANDDWGSYATERAEICQFIYDNGIQRVFILSGDMHAQAVDDGRNSKYALSAPDPNTPYITAAGTAVGGIPLFHVAPLHQNASQKGGPYWKGPDPVSGSAVTERFGLVTVTIDGAQTYVGFSGRDATGAQVGSIFHTFNGTESPKNT